MSGSCKVGDAHISRYSNSRWSLCAYNGVVSNVFRWRPERSHAWVAGAHKLEMLLAFAFTHLPGKLIFNCIAYCLCKFCDLDKSFMDVFVCS